LPAAADEIILRPFVWAYSFLTVTIGATIFYVSVPKAITGLSDLIDTVDQQKKKIEYLATHDALTGLPTLRLALDRLDVSISNAKRAKHKVALLSLDLDGFKQVNDTYGHEAGDMVLQSVAKRLEGVVREGDTACRMGGDEFIVLLSNIDHRDAVEEICKRLIASIGEPVSYENTDLVVGVSIGVAMYPDHAVNSAGLRKVSDDVMYIVKKSGKNNFLFAEDQKT
jgi:diguanylate cyclase (GGDEF)-like protein